MFATMEMQFSSLSSIVMAGLDSQAPNPKPQTPFSTFDPLPGVAVFPASATAFGRGVASMGVRMPMASAGPRLPTNADVSTRLCQVVCSLSFVHKLWGDLHWKVCLVSRSRISIFSGRSNNPGKKLWGTGHR